MRPSKVCETEPLAPLTLACWNTPVTVPNRLSSIHSAAVSLLPANPFHANVTGNEQLLAVMLTGAPTVAFAEPSPPEDPDAETGARATAVVASTANTVMTKRLMTASSASRVAWPRWSRLDGNDAIDARQLPASSGLTIR